jgi:dUTP pyrophosphatase
VASTHDFIVAPIKFVDGADDEFLPTYATKGSAGMDLKAFLAEGEEKCIRHGWPPVLVPVGFSIAIPQGYEAQIRSRSGLALKYGVCVANSPGTIDSDYRGVVQVMLHKVYPGEFVIRRGDRIAQMIISPVMRAHLVTTQYLAETERGEGGFGSTGV